MRATATDLNKQPGKYINEALRQPVVFERSGRPVVVMVSYERYIQLEDSYWGESAVIADQEKSLSKKATMDFLNSDD